MSRLAVSPVFFSSPLAVQLLVLSFGGCSACSGRYRRHSHGRAAARVVLPKPLHVCVSYLYDCHPLSSSESRAEGRYDNTISLHKPETFISNHYYRSENDFHPSDVQLGLSALASPNETSARSTCFVFATALYRLDRLTDQHILAALTSTKQAFVRLACCFVWQHTWE